MQIRKQYKGVMKIFREKIVFHNLQPYVSRKYVEIYLDGDQQKRFLKRYGYIKLYNRKKPKKFKRLAFFWHLHSIVEGEHR